MPPRNVLFDDDDDAPVDPPVLKVNEEFARRFEHNKRREELHRLQAKHPEMAEKFERELKVLAQRPKPGASQVEQRVQARQDEGEGDDDEDEEEEDIDDDAANLLEPHFLSTLLSIRKKDPSIYDPNKKFFPDDEEDEETSGGEERDQGAPASKRHKPMYLKDVIAKQVLEHGPDAGSSSEEEVDEANPPSLAYNQEKDLALQAFKEAIKQEVGEGEEDDDEDEFGGGVLKRRARMDSTGEGVGKDEDVNKLLEDYFGREEDKLSAQDKFLRNFIINKGWLDEREEDGYVPRYEEIFGDEVDKGEGRVGGQEDDEQFWEEADRYEASYNFRFEEPGSSKLATHPRVIPDAVRKEESKRKNQRAAKAERRAAEVSTVKEEVKRLKNLKKKEIEDRLSKIESVAGKAGPKEDLLATMLEGDFDPEEWDKQMAAAFNDDYYAADEAGEEVFDEEAEVEDVGGYDDEGERDGFEQLRKRIKAGEVSGGADEEDGQEADDEGEGEEDGEEEGEGEEANEEKAKKLAEERASLQRLLEEYYKLDYEDVVAGMPTRFRYKQVEGSTFGLSVDDILHRSDKELNQIVGMKRLATYYDPGFKVRPNYKALEALRKEAPTNRKFKAGRPQQGRKQFFDREDNANGWRKRQDSHQVSREGLKPVPKQPASSSAADAEGGQGGGVAIKAEGGSESKPHADGRGQENRKRARQDYKDNKKKSGGEEKTRQQLRLESYAKLTLHKERDSGAAPKSKKKSKQHAADKEAKQVNSGPSRHELVPGWAQMTKAQRKNYMRAEKRASKKQKVDGGS